MNFPQSFRWSFLLALAVSLGMARPARAQNAGPTVAIADPAKIFNKMNETNVLKEKMEKERQALVQEEKDKMDAIDAMKGRLKNLKPDSPQYAEEDAKLLQASIEIKVWRELHMANQQRVMKRQMKTLFDKIETAIADIAQQRGYSIVVAEQGMDIPEDMDAITIEQLQTLIGRRDVLYAAKGIDITELVINDLNAKYAQ
jgi:Skp family chaperone for outer membrane proteins